MRYYLGYPVGQAYPPQLFKAASDPTFATHGKQYSCVVGPFRTKRGAIFMQIYGRANPHCRTVDEAEQNAAKVFLTITNVARRVE